MNKHKLFLFLLLCLLFQLSQAQLAEQQAANYFGKGKVGVNWVRQDSIEFEIRINSKGLVSGRVGEANITIGYFKKALSGKQNYVIEAFLSGPIIRAENLKRDQIFLTLHSKNNRLYGEFKTNGIKMDGKETLVFSGSGLTLSMKINKK